MLGLGLDIETSSLRDDEIIEIISKRKSKLLILDGLQRTYTIRDLLRDLKDDNNKNLHKILNYPLRIEIYIGINKLGILYRMLTLNTGQTPMSSRHQIEIIYSDYIDRDIEGIHLIKQVDADAPNKLGEYSFKDVIDGFTSYLERDYLAIERKDILDNIKSLEKLSIENQQKDLFVQFLIIFNSFVNKIYEIGNQWSYEEYYDGDDLGGPPFAKEVIKMFNKSQVLTGFGSALGKLIDLKAVENLDTVSHLIENINTEDINYDLNNLILRLDNLRLIAKKIGNDQRLFFHYLFREIFDKKSDGFLQFGESIKQAYSQYERRTKL